MNQQDGARIAASRVLHLARHLRARVSGGLSPRELADVLDEIRAASLALGGHLVTVDQPEPDRLAGPDPRRPGRATSLAGEIVELAEDVDVLVELGLLSATRRIGESQREADRRSGPAAVAWTAMHARIRALDGSGQVIPIAGRASRTEQASRAERRAAK